MTKFHDVPLDFETYYDSDYSLSKMTAEEYIRDPRFQIIGLGIRWPGHSTRWLTNMTHEQMAATLQRMDWSDKIAIGHNLSEFDALILTEKLGIRPRFYQCTLSMARSLHNGKTANSLANLCKMYGLPDKGNEVVMAKGKRLEDFTPQELAAYGTYCVNDVDQCYALYNLLKPRLPPKELHYLHMMIRMFAEPRLQLDTDLLQQLLNEEVARKDRVLEDVATLKGVDLPGALKLLNSNAKFAELLREQGVEPPTKISKRTGKEAYAFAKTDRAMEELQEDPNPVVRTLAAARVGTKSTIVESRLGRFLGISKRGLLPAPIVYGRTHTHRAAGSGKLNLQNLSRNKAVSDKTLLGTLLITPVGVEQFKRLSPDGKQLQTTAGNVHLTKLCHEAGLRDCIGVPEGKVLVVVDSSNIELRVCHLLAGQMDTVQKLWLPDTDLYADFATELYGYTVTKDTHYKERQHGKVGMLQLQYQSGGTAFRNAARVMGGVHLTQDESDRTVEIYRQRFGNIPLLWNTCRDSIDDMFHGRQKYIDQWGLCRTEKDRIILPSGLPITYHNLRREPDDMGRMQWVYDDKEKRHPKKVYGGSATENLSQGLAREVVFEQALEIEKRWGNWYEDGTGVAMTVHDETVAVVDEDDADECLAWCIGAMSQSPKWWPQLPVAAEGAIGLYYGECK